MIFPPKFDLISLAKDFLKAALRTVKLLLAAKLSRYSGSFDID